MCPHADHKLRFKLTNLLLQFENTPRPPAHIEFNWINTTPLYLFSCVFKRADRFDRVH